MPVRLADGRALILRDARHVGGEQVHACFQHSFRECEPFIATTADEAAGFGLADVQRWIDDADPAVGRFWLVATDGEGLVQASLSLHVEDRVRFTHVAKLGMTSRSSFWGSGIGTAMLSASIDWCREHPVLRRISLEVFADNPRAIHLYEKHGFTHEGRRVAHAQVRAGVFVDLISMGRAV